MTIRHFEVKLDDNATVVIDIVIITVNEILFYYWIWCSDKLK